MTESCASYDLCTYVIWLIFVLYILFDEYKFTTNTDTVILSIKLQIFLSIIILKDRNIVCTKILNMIFTYFDDYTENTPPLTFMILWINNITASKTNSLNFSLSPSKSVSIDYVWEFENFSITLSCIFKEETSCDLLCLKRLFTLAVNYWRRTKKFGILREVETGSSRQTTTDLMK